MMEERNVRITTFILSATVFLVSIGDVGATEPGPGVLHARFVYVDSLKDDPLTKDKCKPPEEAGALGGIASDIAVSLAGKVAESIVDAIAAQTQAEATTLEAVTPLDGFYTAKGVAVGKGCLVVHNGREADADGASFKAIFQVDVSPDKTAFRFTVVNWVFTRFLKPTTNRWFQDTNSRDFALRVEFLSPGSEGLGRRTVFFESVFTDIDSATLGKAIEEGQRLPWLAAPVPPSGKLGVSLPLNIRVTVVETTRPKQFAIWLQDIATSKKADVVGAVQDAVRKSIDPNFAATQDAQSATAAGTAYSAYKAAWDAYAAQVAAKPTSPTAAATDAEKAAYAAALASWQAGVTVNMRLTDAKKVAAKTLFAVASLPWPGDLPSIGN
jgi:hypothetical protein